jgi:CheY-like chemotaxis protein
VRQVRSLGAGGEPISDLTSTFAASRATATIYRALQQGFLDDGATDAQHRSPNPPTPAIYRRQNPARYRCDSQSSKLLDTCPACRLRNPVSKIIVLVDDHAIVRQGLRSVLEREPQFAIVGDASSAAEALAVVAHQHPSIVLLDLKLSTSSDSEGLQQIQVAERIKSEQGMSAWPTCSQKTGQTAGSANTGSSGSGSSGSGSANSGSANSRSAVSGAAGSGSGVKADDAAATPAPQPTSAPAAGTHTVATGDTLQRDRVEQRDDGAGARAAQRARRPGRPAARPAARPALSRSPREFPHGGPGTSPVPGSPRVRGRHTLRSR